MSDPGAMIEEFLSSAPWSKMVVDLQLMVHAQLEAQVEPLRLQPNKYAPTGTLVVRPPSNASEWRVTTHAGNDIIRHKYLSCSVMPAAGFLYTKMGVHANMSKGTPFLDIELGGSAHRMLLTLTFVPRLPTTRMPDYVHRYYRTTPPAPPLTSSHEGPSEAAPALLSFSQVYLRMLSKAHTPGVTMVSDLTPGGQAAYSIPVYHPYLSKQMWTRIMQGHAAMFSFDACDASAMATVREDVAALVAAWAAWAKADAHAPDLTGRLLQDCQEMSTSWPMC